MPNYCVYLLLFSANYKTGEDHFLMRTSPFLIFSGSIAIRGVPFTPEFIDLAGSSAKIDANDDDVFMIFPFQAQVALCC